MPDFNMEIGSAFPISEFLGEGAREGLTKTLTRGKRLEMDSDLKLLSLVPANKVKN